MEDVLPGDAMVYLEIGLVAHKTAICDSIAAIPPYSAQEAERAALTCDTPPQVHAFKHHNCAMPCDTLKNVDAIGYSKRYCYTL